MRGSAARLDPCTTLKNANFRCRTAFAIAALVEAACGHFSAERKRDLVYGRLSRRLRTLRCPASPIIAALTPTADERRVMLQRHHHQPHAFLP